MIDALNLALYPVIWLLTLVFDALVAVTSSPGMAVILLAVIVSLATHPLRIRATGVEQRARSKKRMVNEQITREATGLKGEARFQVVERVYAEYKYNPIQDVKLGASFFVVLPFLVSALFLFNDSPELAGASFLFISDLSRPDQLVGSINLLPFAMSAITILDATIRFKGDRGALIRFIFIAVVLLALVYNLSSALVLYWTTSNMISLFTYLYQASVRLRSNAHSTLTDR